MSSGLRGLKRLAVFRPEVPARDVVIMTLLTLPVWVAAAWAVRSDAPAAWLWLGGGRRHVATALESMLGGVASACWLQVAVPYVVGYLARRCGWAEETTGSVLSWSFEVVTGLLWLLLVGAVVIGFVLVLAQDKRTPLALVVSELVVNLTLVCPCVPKVYNAVFAGLDSAATPTVEAPDLLN